MFVFKVKDNSHEVDSFYLGLLRMKMNPNLNLNTCVLCDLLLVYTQASHCQTKQPRVSVSVCVTHKHK